MISGIKNSTGNSKRLYITSGSKKPLIHTWAYQNYCEEVFQTEIQCPTLPEFH